MKSYPYIGQYKTTNTETNVLYYKQDCCINMDDREQKTTDRYREGLFKNITREYLANTYGEVVSPEHAEFIIELCKVGGIDFVASKKGISKFKYFRINESYLGFYTEPRNAKSQGPKKITIPLPLPPSQIQTATPEEEFEMEQIMKNAGDNLVLGCEDSKCDEWPCVGDDVTVRIDAHQWDVKYGHNVDGMNGVVRSIFEDGDVTVYAVSVDGVCYCFVRGLLQKPKTPEEDLRDDIVQTIHDDVYHGDYEKQYLEVFANALMSKYNITKKPQ